jgi:hypothetical protein
MHRKALLPSATIGAAEQNPWKPIVAFVHIPRTGGGSVTSAISRAYGRAQSAGNVQLGTEKTHNVLQRIAENLDAWSGRAVTDHVPYGLYARYLPPDTRYITFLRDPVERVLSHYYFHAQAGPEKVRMIWRREVEAAGKGAPVVGDHDDVSLEAGLARGISIYNNFATRFLWGGESLLVDLPTNALERAKENITGFAFVGVTERLDEAVILLGRMLDVPLVGYHLRHVREGRPKANDVPAGLIRLIEQHNALDIELYRIARERFDAEAAAAGDVTGEVEELRRQRAEVTEEAEAARAESKTAGKALRRTVKRDRGGRRRNATPDAARDSDDLREELAALRRRMLEIEAALGTRNGGNAGGAGAAAQPRTTRAAHGGLHVPWRRQRREQRAGGAAPGELPARPAADDEPPPKSEKQKPAGSAKKSGERTADRYGPDGERMRKRRKRSSAKIGGEGPKKVRPQLQDDAPADRTGGDEPGPQPAANAP